MYKTLTESATDASVTTARRTTNEPANDSTDFQTGSTLIEFPGSRNVPEWRKHLSQRVREVQEQKAREAAEVEAAIRESETVSCALPSGQLELVPDREQAPLNPIVFKALERVDRARRNGDVRPGFSATAAAPALAPPEPETEEPFTEPEPKPKLTIVTPTVTPVAEPAFVTSAETDALTDKPKRVGVISASVEESALSYLETCLSLPAHSCDRRSDLAGLTRRSFVGLIDLLLLALMVSPVVAAFEAAALEWSNPRVVGVMSGITAVTMFTYLTLTIGLTGRTLAMRLLSVRTIDERTGLIPTGGQAIKRALVYVFSLALFGVGLAFALIDRDRRTLHDRFSKTIVVRA